MFSVSSLHNRICERCFFTRACTLNLFLLLGERKKIRMKRQSHYVNRKTQAGKYRQLASRDRRPGRRGCVVRAAGCARAAGGAAVALQPSCLVSPSHFHYYVTFISFYFETCMRSRYFQRFFL